VGDHTTWLLPHDPPLASDIAAIALGTSKWVRTPGTVAAMPFDAVAAIEAALAPIPGVATLILRADLLEAPLGKDFVMPPASRVAPFAPPPAPEVIAETLALVRGGRSDGRSRFEGRTPARGEGRRQSALRAVPAMHPPRAGPAVP
jgi:thiamine pyrophosphate-dependent acetolactate synthase large subunit-like protein